MPVVSSQMALLGKAPVYTALGMVSNSRDQLPNDYPRWDLNVQDLFRSLSTTDQALVLAGWLALRSLSPSWLSEITFRVPAHSFSLQLEAK